MEDIGKGKWYGLTTVAGTAWIFGKIAARNEFELGSREVTPHKRAEHIQNGETLDLVSNVGVAYLLYDLFKRHPKLAAGGVMAWVGVSAFFSSIEAGGPFIDSLMGRSRLSSHATGWDQWYVGAPGQDYSFTRRPGYNDKNY
jgi:hypothetical protein